MAEVYDYVPGMPASRVTRTLENGNVKHSQANQLERVIAMHGDVRDRLAKEGAAVGQRAAFRLSARQQRHMMQLREEEARAILSGDPERIETAQRRRDRYENDKTRVFTSHADVDFHIGFFREDGREFFVEADSREGDRGLEILQKSLRG